MYLLMADAMQGDCFLATLQFWYQVVLVALRGGNDALA